MSYRAMALVAASLLFATQCYAEIKSTSKSNSFKAINASDPAAVAACTKGGGTVGKDPKGKDACVTPESKNLNSSRSN
jgi:hypothetical protein